VELLLIVDVIIGEGVMRWAPPENCIPIGEAGPGTNETGRDVRFVLPLATGFRVPVGDNGVLVKGPNAGELLDITRMDPTPPTLLAAIAAETAAAVPAIDPTLRDPTPFAEVECSAVGRRFNPGRWPFASARACFVPIP
jgi:hypothetical protein